MNNKTINYKKKILETIKTLSELYPNQFLASHIAIATSDFSSLAGISDKEFYYMLEKYVCEKELDITPSIYEKDIDKIYKESLNLNIDDLINEDDEF